MNVYLPADVHKGVLHDIHWRAWELGLKSLYYCRSKSVQRAESDKPHMAGTMPTEAYRPDVNPSQPQYEECLSCQ